MIVLLDTWKVRSSILSTGGEKLRLIESIVTSIQIGIRPVDTRGRHQYIHLSINVE